MFIYVHLPQPLSYLNIVVSRLKGTLAAARNANSRAEAIYYSEVARGGDSLY